jgi:addiction module RelE/StbE family toxin
MNLRYTVSALRHIEEIHKYIAERDTEAARRVVLRIERSIGRLAFLPLSGRPGVVAGTRTLVVPGLPYVVIYRVRGELVDIVAVLHTARRRRS